MAKSCLHNRIKLAIAVFAAAVMPGGERPLEQKAGHKAQAVMRVEVVKPERQTVQRTVGEPGQLVAVETTPIHAKSAGYVQKVSVDIGYEIKKGQILAELSVPEDEADLQEK